MNTVRIDLEKAEAPLIDDATPGAPVMVHHGASTPRRGTVMDIRNRGRRRFLGLTATIAVLPMLSPLAAAAPAKPAAPAKLPKLTDANPVAKGLGYSENAASVKHAMYKPGSTCATCSQFKAVAGGGAYGLCTLFPQNMVASKGWCAAWAKKA